MDILAPSTLLDRQDLAERGIGWRKAAELRERKVLTMVRPGICVFTDEWATLTPEERMRLRARAVERSSRNVHIFSNLTALAQHGLPVVFADVSGVHTTARRERGGALAGVVRHRGPLRDDEIVEVDGMLCTSIERTLADVARTQRRETSVSAIDAALRSVSVHERKYDENAAGVLRDKALVISTRASHGPSRARRALSFGDGRAELPGESISRVRLVQLGFDIPRLQVAVRAPNGGNYYVDLGLDDVESLAEFDGKGKYSDPKFLAGRTPQQALDDEKAREDWIRGVTGLKLVRWQWEHITTPEELGRRLAHFGVRPPRR
ncbi:hypothetical protein [Microbacterium allomyrinae]|uniref:Transcriptional regulator, AbiEi antitoxin, Type IV TA system n=1 Tax=Microbacterium allomyrinae TaxID=2830666 RepID=A0A9X1S3N6_9MICO|nr:hypothetical protein [Microbacterium allomyrinae]MCC2033374.1 hypothetical protein [Microbacterium allomyrinae]